MSRTLRFAILFLVLGLFAAAMLSICAPLLRAQTPITLASYTGTIAPAGVANSPIAWSNSTGGGIAALTYDFSGAAAMPGASYVTYMQGSTPAVGVTQYSTTFSGSLAGGSGTLSFAADDTAVVTLNGVQLAATTPDQWNTVLTVPIPAGALVSGMNTLTFAVMNTAGYTGLMFQGTVMPPDRCSAALAAMLPAATPGGCALPANAVRIGGDGEILSVLRLSAPVLLMYCADAPAAGAAAVCNAPVLFGLGNPVAIGPIALFGGAPVAGAPGSLYAIPGARSFTLTTATPGPVVTIDAAR